MKNCVAASSLKSILRDMSFTVRRRFLEKHTEWPERCLADEQRTGRREVRGVAAVQRQRHVGAERQHRAVEQVEAAGALGIPLRLPEPALGVRLDAAVVVEVDA